MKTRSWPPPRANSANPAKTRACIGFAHLRSPASRANTERSTPRRPASTQSLWAALDMELTVSHSNQHPLHPVWAKALGVPTPSSTVLPPKPANASVTASQATDGWQVVAAVNPRPGARSASKSRSAHTCGSARPCVPATRATHPPCMSETLTHWSHHEPAFSTQNHCQEVTCQARRCGH